MTTPLRVATFNVENLFTRAKALNFVDNAAGDAILKRIDDLRVELRRKQYDAPTIISLYDQLKEYIEIVEVRGKLFKGQSRKALSAKGVDDWRGHIAFKRAKHDESARKNTAEVLYTVNADIQGFIEVEDRPTLRHFCIDRMPARTKFAQWKHHMLIDGNDNRGIDVALASRFPIVRMRSHIDDLDGKSPIFSRDCLEIQVAHPTGDIWILLNHFKSKGYGVQSTSDAKRKKQADRVAQILTRDYDLTKDRVIVMGDLNDTPTSAPLATLLSVPHLTDVLTQAFASPSDRWTYHYRKNEQIDYLLVSGPLRTALSGAGVERRGIYNVSKFTNGQTHSFASVAKPTDAGSDHGAVWADFQL